MAVADVRIPLSELTEGGHAGVRFTPQHLKMLTRAGLVNDDGDNVVAICPPESATALVAALARLHGCTSASVWQHLAQGDPDGVHAARNLADVGRFGELWRYARLRPSPVHFRARDGRVWSMPGETLTSHGPLMRWLAAPIPESCGYSMGYPCRYSALLGGWTVEELIG